MGDMMKNIEPGTEEPSDSLDSGDYSKDTTTEAPPAAATTAEDSIVESAIVFNKKGKMKWEKHGGVKPVSEDMSMSSASEDTTTPPTSV